MKNSETRRNDPHRTNDVLTATATDPKLLLVLPLQLLLSVAVPLIVPPASSDSAGALDVG